MRVWGLLAEGLARRGDAVLVTIREARGSTPRDAGTQMIIFADGTFTGTIGGGTLEWRVIAEAQRLLAAPDLPSEAATDRLEGEGDLVLATRGITRAFALGPQLGQCCGGHVTLQFERLSASHLPVISRLGSIESTGQLRLARSETGDRILRSLAASSSPSNASAADLETYGETHRPLYLFGAGHVGRALVLALAALPFRVLWIDPRREAFPAMAPANVSMISPEDPVATLASAPAGSFVLAITHSHALDQAICDAALRDDSFAYVGVIGSATKRARFESRLAEAGVVPEAIARLVCPIGANGPKSKLPAVIAAAVAVELLVADESCAKLGTIHAKANAGRDFMLQSERRGAVE